MPRPPPPATALTSSGVEIFRASFSASALEFASPPGVLFRRIYLAYLKWVVPLVGAVVSGRGSAYTYLSTSIRSFADQEKMSAILRGIGFESVRHIDFARGIAALYIGHRPETGR